MKRLYKLLFLTFILLSFTKVRSQDLTNYNLYNHNPILYNPAFTFDNAKIMAFANSHLQWIGFPGAPEVFTFGVNANFIDNMGFGISGYQSKQGLNTQTNINLSYAYRVLFEKYHHITFGLASGVFMEGLNYNLVDNSNYVDPWFSANGNKSTSIAARFGFSYYFKGIEFQFAMPQLYQRKEFSAHLIGILSYDWNINEDWIVKPSFLGRYVQTSKFQFDGNLMGMWKKKIWLQTGYRSSKSFIFSAGYNFDRYSLGYAYQMDRGNFADASRGTHEIQLIFRFNKHKSSKWEYVDPNADKVGVVVNIRDSKDNRPIGGTFKVYQNETIVCKNRTSSNGEVTSFVSPNKYDVEIYANGYLPIKETIDLSTKMPGDVCVKEYRPVKVEKETVFHFGSITFETGSDKLNSSSNGTLNLVAQVFLDNPKIKMEIGGHSDNIGDEEFNLELSGKRAVAVKNYFLAKGIKEKQIVTKGYGSSKPIADNSTEEGRLENRRVEFTVLDF